MILWRGKGRAVSEPHLIHLAEAIARARAQVPWPLKEVLSDGSVRCSGLTEVEINRHIARHLARELEEMSLPLTVVQSAARAVFEAESEILKIPLDEQQYVNSGAIYRIAALAGFRGILKSLRHKA